MSTDRDPLNAGLASRFTDSTGFIIGPAWTRAHEAREIVGTCRVPHCGGLMQAIDTHEENRITWYGAECNNCGHEIASPNGTTLARSSRREESPNGAWEKRIELLTKLRDLAKRQGERTAA